MRKHILSIRSHHPVCATSRADWHDISAVFQPTGVTSGGKEEFHSEHPHDTGSNSRVAHEKKKFRYRGAPHGISKLVQKNEFYALL